MNHKEYNGWYNYETWVVNLWMDNEEGIHDYWREQAQEIYKETEPTDNTPKTIQAKWNLANIIKEQITENNPLIEEATLYSDLMSAALSEVNWDEIANHFIDIVLEELPQV